MNHLLSPEYLLCRKEIRPTKTGHWLEIMTPLDQEKDMLYNLSQQYESASVDGEVVISRKENRQSSVCFNLFFKS